MTATYTCPVCGYAHMPYAPEDYNICPCCGTQFGYEDSAFTYRELRNRWLGRGARWFSPSDNSPHKWNPIVQLQEAGYDFDADVPDEFKIADVTLRFVMVLDSEDIVNTHLTLRATAG